jgi:hypothetical protein
MTTSAQPAILFENVSRHFGEVRAVDGIDLRSAKANSSRFGAIGLGQNNLSADDGRI